MMLSLPVDESTPDEKPVVEPKPVSTELAQEAPEEPDKSFEVGWWLYVVIVRCVIIGGLAVHLFWRRRTKKGLT